MSDTESWMHEHHWCEPTRDVVRDIKLDVNMTLNDCARQVDAARRDFNKVYFVPSRTLSPLPSLGSP